MHGHFGHARHRQPQHCNQLAMQVLGILLVAASHLGHVFHKANGLLHHLPGILRAVMPGHFQQGAGHMVILIQHFGTAQDAFLALLILALCVKGQRQQQQVFYAAGPLAQTLLHHFLSQVRKIQRHSHAAEGRRLIVRFAQRHGLLERRAAGLRHISHAQCLCQLQAAIQILRLHIAGNVGVLQRTAGLMRMQIQFAQQLRTLGRFTAFPG